MSHLRVTEEELHLLTRIAAESLQFPLADFEGAIRHILGELAREMDASNGYWVLAVRSENERSGIEGGWSVVAVHLLHETASRRERAAETAARLLSGKPDLMTERYAGRVGEDRAARPIDLMTRGEWKRDWYVRNVLIPEGVSDVVQASSVVHPRAEVTIGLEHTGDRRFDERDRDLLLTAAVVLRRPLRAMVLTGGWLGSGTALTPRQREVLDAILEGKSEPEIAADLGIADRTVHNHASSLYRKLDVRGRAGLLALWSGRGATD